MGGSGWVGGCGGGGGWVGGGEGVAHPSFKRMENSNLKINKVYSYTLLATSLAGCICGCDKG